MSYDATNWPPLQIPPVASQSLIGPTIEGENFPPTQLPTAPSYQQTWTPSAAPVNVQTVRDPATTQQQVSSYFGIISINPGQATPGSNVVPGGEIGS